MPVTSWDCQFESSSGRGDLKSSHLCLPLTQPPPTTHTHKFVTMWVGDVNLLCDCFTIYTSIKSWCHTAETNIILHVTCISVKIHLCTHTHTHIHTQAQWVLPHSYPLFSLPSDTWQARSSSSFHPITTSHLLQARRSSHCAHNPLSWLGYHLPICLLSGNQPHLSF